ncbi:MAG: orotate phosphoribosyltransferase [Treponema sp.]|nr:orotate phosphoribosyltransferase [Treponema sp.]
MKNVTDLLLESGAMLEGHFLLSSGRHSDKYFQCAKLLQYPQKSQAALEDVVTRIKDDIISGKLKVDLIAGPAMGGIVAAWEAARQLSSALKREIRSVFTERDEKGVMCLRRGFEISQGQNILIVEDVVTTGKSSAECAAALELLGANITALACVVDRREEGIDVKWPLYPAVKIKAGNWEAKDCDLCKHGTPAVKPGSRKF